MKGLRGQEVCVLCHLPSSHFSFQCRVNAQLHAGLEPSDTCQCVCRACPNTCHRTSALAHINQELLGLNTPGQADRHMLQPPVIQETIPQGIPCASQRPLNLRNWIPAACIRTWMVHLYVDFSSFPVPLSFFLWIASQAEHLHPRPWMVFCF